VVKNEQALLERLADRDEASASVMSEMNSNRRGYENKLLAVLGKEKWTDYKKFYQQYWEITSDRESLYQPIK